MLRPLLERWETFKKRYQQRHPRAFGEEDIPDDVYLVIQASSDLDIAEFTVFMNAYERWFGRPGEEARVERHYLGYMFHARVPPWVREYCRQVIAEAQHHRLDPVTFGVLPKLTRRVKTGLAMFAVAFGFLVLLFTVAEYTLQDRYQHTGVLDRTSVGARP